MEVRSRAFGVLAAICVMAAGLGGYVALRQNAALAPLSKTVALLDSGPGQPAPVATAPQTVLTSQLAAIEPPTPTVENVAPLAPAAGLAAEPKTEVPAAPPRARTKIRTTETKTTLQAKPTTVEAAVTGPEAEDGKPPAPALAGPANGTEAAALEEDKPPLPVPVAAETAVTLPVDEPAAEPVAERLGQELVVPADSVLGLELETALSSAQSHVEDPVRARVTRDLRVGGRIAIPAGSEVLGSVTQVDRGGKMRERPRLGFRFHTLLLVDHSRNTLETEIIYREGPAPAGKSAAKVGGAAVGGAILGAIIGGRKGALIGGSIGAAGGVAAAQMGEPDAAVLPAGTVMTVRILSPVTVTVDTP